MTTENVYNTGQIVIFFVTKHTHETKRFINPYKESMTEEDKKG